MIYLAGDTHIPIDIGKLDAFDFPQQNHMTRDDYVIILGDFGLYWKDNDVFYKWYEWLNQRNFTVLWVDGNHENFDWIATLPKSEWNGGIVQRDGNIIHLMRGNIYTIEEQTFFIFGGAYSIDKAYRTPGLSWWKAEEYNDKEKDLALSNLAKYDYKVDYVLTHACPYSIKQIMFDFHDDTRTELFLEEIKSKISYKDWYFGHYHYDKDYEHFHALYYDVRRLGQ